MNSIKYINSISKKSIQIFWAFILFSLTSILTHLLLTTSDIPISSSVKNILFILNSAVIYLYFSKFDKFGIITTLVILSFFAVTPHIPFLRYIYYLAGIFCTTRLLFSGSFFSLKGLLHKTHLVFGILLLIIGLSINWISNYNYLDLLYKGWIHIDTIWPCSISAMYKNYHVASLGIDGLHPVTYHTFLQKSFAGISIISGLKSIEVFALFYPIIAPSIFFLVLLNTIKLFKPNLNTNDSIGTGILFYVFYITFPMRTVNVGPDFFLSESMFLGTILFLSAIGIIYRFQQTNNTFLLLLYVLLSFFITSTKSNVGLFNAMLIGGVLITNIKNAKLWLTAILTWVITILVMKSVALSASSQSSWYDPDFRFGATIIRFESLLPKIGITNDIIRILYFTVVFYSPVIWFYFLFFNKSKNNYWKDIRFILITGSLIVSVIFNYFLCIGFNTFYFTGPVIFFTFLGIVSMINIPKFDYLYLTIILVGICAYSSLDLIRMGSPSNCNNYVYNLLRAKENKRVNKNQINKLISISRGNNIVIKYNLDSIDTGNFGKEAYPFIISALSECVTVGHVPKYDFYGHGDYRKPYKVVLPKNYTVIDLNKL